MDTSVARREREPRAARLPTRSIFSIGNETRKLAEAVTARLVEQAVSAGPMLGGDAAAGLVEQHVLAPRRAADLSEAETIIRDTLAERVAAAETAGVPLTMRLATTLAATGQRSVRDDVRDMLALLDVCELADAERDRLGPAQFEAQERERERLAEQAGDAQRLLNDPAAITAEAARRVEAVYARIRDGVATRVDGARVRAEVDRLAAVRHEQERVEQQQARTLKATRSVEWPAFPGAMVGQDDPTMATAMRAMDFLVRDRQTLRPRDLRRLLGKSLRFTARDRCEHVEEAVRLVVEALRGARYGITLDEMASAPASAVHVLRAVVWARLLEDGTPAPTVNERKAAQRQRDRDLVGYRCRACARRDEPVETNHFWSGLGKHRNVRTDQVRAIIRDSGGAAPPWWVPDEKGGGWVEPLCKQCHAHQSKRQRRGCPWGDRWDPVTGEPYSPERDPDGSGLARSLPVAAP